ncbi:outer membrane protein assembly factor BamE [Roseicyclus sp.]|uniref:outer membrane protein assembly factor BamE n=1 Tax=Roseicyclus sp. TaxID=1914329 RepID=UPI003F6D5254
MLRQAREFRKGLIGLALVLSLAACDATFDNHGYVPPADALAAVQIGASRDAVIAAIGTPGSAGVMRDEAWLYTAYRIRNLGFRAPQLTERQLLAISFDRNGRVSNVEEFGLEDGRVVQLSRRVTTSSVREVTFFGQLLGNFGRINIGQALDN